MSTSPTSASSRFRRRSRNITLAAVITGLLAVAPMLLEIPRTRGPGMTGQAVTGVLAGAVIAWVLWSTAWTLPAVVGATLARLDGLAAPRVVTRLVMLVTLPIQLAVAVVYGALGGGVRERARVRRAADAGSAPT